MSYYILSFISLFLLIIGNCHTYIPNLTPSWFEFAGNISIPVIIFIFIEHYHNTNNKFKLMTKLFTYGIVMCSVNLITYYLCKMLNINIHILLYKTNIFLILALCCALIETTKRLKAIKRLSVKLNLIIFVFIEVILVSLCQYDIFVIFTLFIFYKYQQKTFIRNIIFTIGIIVLSILLNSVNSMTMIISIVIISEYSKLVEYLKYKPTVYNQNCFYNIYLISILALNILTIYN